jgi:hypothetical protein
VRRQTELLRAAPLARPTRPVVVGVPARARLRRRAAAVAGALVVAATAALLALTPVAGERGGVNTASAGSSAPLLAVVPAQPTANATFELPRLGVVSPASADGPVRGFYRVPA